MSDELKNRNEFLKMLDQEVTEESVSEMSQVWAKNFNTSNYSFSNGFSESVMDQLRKSRETGTEWWTGMQWYFTRLLATSLCIIALWSVVLMIQEGSWSIDSLTGNTLANQYEWSLMLD